MTNGLRYLLTQRGYKLVLTLQEVNQLVSQAEGDSKQSWEYSSVSKIVLSTQETLGLNHQHSILWTPVLGK